RVSPCFLDHGARPSDPLTAAKVRGAIRLYLSLGDHVPKRAALPIEFWISFHAETFTPKRRPVVDKICLENSVNSVAVVRPRICKRHERGKPCRAGFTRGALVQRGHDLSTVGDQQKTLNFFSLSHVEETSDPPERARTCCTNASFA